MLDQVFDREGVFIHSVTSLPYFAKFRNNVAEFQKCGSRQRIVLGSDLEQASSFLI